MKSTLIALLFIIAISSCTINKRLYNPGYYISNTKIISNKSIYNGGTKQITNSLDYLIPITAFVLDTPTPKQSAKEKEIQNEVFNETEKEIEKENIAPHKSIREKRIEKKEEHDAIIDAKIKAAKERKSNPNLIRSLGPSRFGMFLCVLLLIAGIIAILFCPLEFIAIPIIVANLAILLMIATGVHIHKLKSHNSNILIEQTKKEEKAKEKEEQKEEQKIENREINIEYEDVITLNDGTIIHGYIVVEGKEIIKLETKHGNMLEYKMVDIEKIYRHKKIE